MKPKKLKTKIFLDSGDPADTIIALDKIGFLDGQTTNPSLIAKNPKAQERLASGKKFTRGELHAFYKEVVEEISQLIPKGSISIEVHATETSKADEMLSQARDMYSWIDNAHIKFPTTIEGIKAAQQAIKEGIRLNMTLVFTQEQAVAVYSATKAYQDKPARLGDLPNVFVSPFAGRFDDKGQNGMDIIKNIIKMYKLGDGHVAVLAASIRTLEHHLYSLALRADIITSPLKILLEWARHGLQVPDSSYSYDSGNLKPLKYKDISLDENWKEYDVDENHVLLREGIEKFVKSYEGLL